MKESRSPESDYPGGRHRRNGALPRVAALTAMLALCVPVGAFGSQQVPDLTRDELTVFARAHVAMNAARDEFHAEIGRAHEEQARERARAAFDEKVAAILQSNGLTREEYDRRVLIVSLDAEMRAALEEILAELAAEGAPGND